MSGTSGEFVSKSFVSENELEEKRKKRQAEWEKARQPDQPLEAPEEEYDPRSLFDRLQEQKDKKQAEYEEAHKLKNLIRGLDDDEVSFLELVDKTKLEMENKIMKEELYEILEYRKAVANLSEEAAKAKLQELKRNLASNQSTSKKTQQTLLAGAVKRRSSESSSDDKRKKTDDSESNAAEVSENGSVVEGGVLTSKHSYPAGLQCIGVLPGLGCYSDSSDSENSSQSDSENDPPFELLARRRIVHHVQEQS